MTQLRHDHEKFVALGVEIVVVGPEDARSFAAFWRGHALPFVGLPDPDNRVSDLYGQEVNLLKLGRMPAQMLIDQSGTVRLAHYGKSMSDIPRNDEILKLSAQFVEQDRRADIP